jgi:transposase-like protein
MTARHGISRQPATQVPRRHGKFEETTLGFVRIDSAEIKVSSGKQHMFVAIDRVTKFTHVAFFDRTTKSNAAQFLRQVLVAFPYRIHTVVTDNGMAFTGQERFRGRVTDTCIGHIFERICKFNGIEKRHTKPYHPWTNGMVERMNRTIKESTIKTYEYEGLEQLREHVQAFVQSYNFGKHLKAFRWNTPFRAMCEAWEKDPSRFRLHPHYLTVGLNKSVEIDLCQHCLNDRLGQWLRIEKASASKKAYQIAMKEIMTSRANQQGPWVFPALEAEAAEELLKLAGILTPTGRIKKQYR